MQIYNLQLFARLPAVCFKPKVIVASVHNDRYSHSLAG